MELATPVREKVFHNRDNELYHLADHQALMVCPIGHVLPDTFIEASRKTLELGKQFQIRYLILNQTQILSIPSSARTWLMVNFLRSSEVRYGIQELEKVIVIRSTNKLAAGLMKVLNGLAEPLLGITITYCDTEKEVLALLKEKLAA